MPRETADERFAAWAAAMSEVHLPWNMRGPAVGDTFQATIESWRLDDLTLVETAYGACSGFRGKSQIAATVGEFLVLVDARGGQEDIAQGDDEATIEPGQWALWDSTRPVKFRAARGHSKRSFLVPAEALGEVGGRRQLPRNGVYQEATGALRLLSSYLGVLTRTLAELEPAGRVAAQHAALELFAGAIRRDPGVAGAAAVSPALRAAMERYIGQHLTDTGVGASVLARTYGVSVRTVNRIFSATGETVGDVIRRRRLARARDDLSVADSTISHIAQRWGFTDGSHFSRSFKDQYGMSPSEYRAAARTRSSQNSV